MINYTPENISYLFIGLIISIIVVLVLLKRKKPYPYFARGALLTAAELKFYHVLKPVTAQQYDISCKVRLGDIINCTDYYWHKGYGPKISSKHIDFVLYDPNTSEIILCIELDDKSHNRPDRIKRDKFVNNALSAANVPILHVPAARGYDMAKLQKDIVLATQ
jgi:hypothetical protein